ncbi:RlpA-like double-psi beta-barrel-protein domain-containing protein-containing protein [Lactarius pseudohatsudake]|nr:RlpA-like double-psi beta-barrel-protein domain-containing protein-containing protein [Lactarius pseudohatsudake]
MSELTFGAQSGLGPGDACGRCFQVTGDSDPSTPSFVGPFNSIVVKVTNLCPASSNEQFCGQTTSQTTNSFSMSVHFELCQDTGTDHAFFPSGHGALTGMYQEVSCSQWSGTDSPILQDSGCLVGESADNWPAVGCDNKGTAPA